MTVKTFTSAFAKYVNLDELVYDITLLVLVLFLRGLIVPPGMTVIDVLNPYTGTALLLGILFSVSYYVGFLDLRYTESLKDRPRTLQSALIILRISLVVLIVTLLIIFYIIFPDADKVLTAAYIFGGLCMVAGGLLWSQSTGEKNGCSFSIAILIGSLIIILFFFCFFNVEDNPASIFRAIGIFAAGFTVLILLFLLDVYVLEKLFDGKNRAGNIIIAVLFNAVIPLMAALMMGFWQEITAAGLIGVLHSGDILNYILPGLMFLSFISTRVMMALAPPYRIINTGIGIASLTVYTVMLIINISSMAGAVK